MTRLLVAEDHPIIVSGLEAALRGTGFEIAAVETDGAGVAAAVARTDPDMIVLDLQLPNVGGIAIAEELRGGGDRRPIVLLTAGIGDDALLRALALGIEGIVLKDRALGRLVQCLEKVRGGGRCVDEGLLQRALDLKMGGGGRGLASLSPREQSVAALVAEGRRNREIGETLGISEGTVKVHLYRIYEKLGVSNRTELAILAGRSLEP